MLSFSGVVAKAVQHVWHSPHGDALTGWTACATIRTHRKQRRQYFGQETISKAGPVTVIIAAGDHHDQRPVLSMWRTRTW